MKTVFISTQLYRTKVRVYLWTFIVPERPTVRQDLKCVRAQPHVASSSIVRIFDRLIKTDERHSDGELLLVTALSSVLRQDADALGISIQYEHSTQNKVSKCFEPG